MTDRRCHVTFAGRAGPGSAAPRRQPLPQLLRAQPRRRGLRPLPRRRAVRPRARAAARRRRSVPLRPGDALRGRAGARQQGGRQDAPAALDQARQPKGPGSCWSRPAPTRRTREFLEYLLFQLIDTLLGGGKQKGARPLEFVGEELVRRLLRRRRCRSCRASSGSTCSRRPAWAAGRASSAWAASQAQERTQWLLDSLARPTPRPFVPGARSPGLRRGRPRAGAGLRGCCAATSSAPRRTTPPA